MMVKLYWNLHRVCWSVQHKGLVVDHATQAMVKDATFKVRESGRQRVIQEKKKNVHAFVCGERVNAMPSDPPWIRISYNPYKSGSFYRCDTGAAITKADFVFHRLDGKVFAINPQ